MTTQSDPVFAAIADFRPYGEALRAAYAIENDDLVAAASSPAFNRLRAIYQMEPQTTAGLLAVMNLMLEWDGNHLRLTDKARRTRLPKGDELDDGEWGLIAVFRNAKRMLEAMNERHRPSPFCHRRSMPNCRNAGH